MSAHIEADNGVIVISSGPREKDLVKRIPGATFDRNAPVGQLIARAPLAFATCVAARGVFGDDLTVGPMLLSWATGERELLDDLLRRQQPCECAECGPPELYPYQRTGRNWLTAAAGAALLTDEPGLGKTIQVLSALDAIANPWPVLIVCTNSMKTKWAEEFEKWGPEHGGIVIIGGTPTQKRKQLAADASVVIINWEALRLHSRLAPYGSMALTEAESTPKELDEWGFTTVIADEVHKASDPHSKWTRAWWNLASGARYRIGMTGTPVRNRPDDLWSIMHGLWSEAFPRKTTWTERYCHTGRNMHGGFEVWGFREDTKAELFSYLDPRMLRRTKAEVLPQLPPKTYEVRTVEMTGKQAKAYKDLRKEMMTEVDGDFLVVDTPLVLHGRLSQCAAGTPVVEEGKVVALQAPSCKVDALLDLLDEMGDAPLVVFAKSRKLIDLCAKALAYRKITFVELTGAVDPIKRGQLVADFQAGMCQVALCTISAVAEGVTLTRADTAVFLQREGSMVLNIQAEDRIHRIGQEASVIRIIDFVAADSIESDVLAVSGPGGMKVGYLQEVVRDHLRG